MMKYMMFGLGGWLLGTTGTLSPFWSDTVDHARDGGSTSVLMFLGAVFLIAGSIVAFVAAVRVLWYRHKFNVLRSKCNSRTRGLRSGRAFA